MRKTEVMKRALSVPLAFCIMLSYVPTTAYAVTEDNLCEHHEVHTAEVCGYVEGEADCTYHCEVCHVQELVDALPESVTAENVDAAAAQLAAIDTAKAELSDGEIAQVDFTKYVAAAEALGSVYNAAPADTGYYAGGIVGSQEGAEITNTSNSGTVTGGETIGDTTEMIQIFIKKPDGTTLTLESAPETTVDSIKETIREKWGYPAANQTLICSGKQLADGGQTLAACGIANGDSIQLIVRWHATIAETANGTVTADVETAAEGETITLTVTPADGYEIGTVSYNDGTNDVTVTASEGVYSFTMPAGDVTVTAVFKEKAAEPVETQTIYFDNSVVQWSTVNAYAWGADNARYLGPWPGTVMTQVAGETAIYSVAVPEGAETIIFHDGSAAQTADQTLGTDNCFKAEETEADGLYIGSWYTYPCTHANETFTDNGDGTHSSACPDCGADTGKVAHTPENGECTACGGAFWTITVIVDPNREYSCIVPAGQDATLNEVYVEEGYVLDGVEVHYSGTYAPVTGFRCGYETVTIPGEYVTADLTVWVSVRTLDIDAHRDHVYAGAPTFTWAEDHSAATATWVCLYEGSTNTVDCTVTFQTQDATCAAEGKTTYTATATWNGTDFTDTKTASIPVDANNHTYDEGKCTGCGAYQPVTVTLNGNGGEIFNGDTFDYQEMVTVLYSNALDLAEYTEKFRRQGHQLTSWNTQADGKGTGYEADGSITVTGDIILYAQWEVNTYTVTWIVEGDTYATTQVKYGDPITAPETDPTKIQEGCTAYTFASWESLTDGMTMPAENQSFTALFTEGEAHDYKIQKDDTHHWYICSRCDKEDGKATHANVADTDGKCDTCGIQLAAAVTTAEGTTYFIKFDDAFTTAQASTGSTLTLLADVTGRYYVESGTFTLDLNGRTITNTEGCGLSIAGYVDLTVTDSSESGTGAVVGTDYAVDMLGDLTVTGSAQLKFTDESGATITTPGGVDLRAADCDGWTIKNNGSGSVSGESYRIPTGYVLYVVDEVTGLEKIMETLGSSDICTIRDHIHEDDAADRNHNCDKCGVLASNHSYGADDTCTECGMGSGVLVTYGDGHTEKKKSVREALVDDSDEEGAADNVVSVQLLCDVTVSSFDEDAIFVFEGTVTLDLNGYSVTASETYEDGVVIYSVGDLTITDSSVSQTGAISPLFYQFAGNLTIEGAPYIETLGCGNSEDEPLSLNLSNATFERLKIMTPGAISESQITGSYGLFDADGNRVESLSGSSREPAIGSIRKLHTHSWIYSALSDTITATCKGNIGECDVKTATLKVVAPTGSLVYDGQVRTATTTGSIDGVDTPVITYTGDRKSVGTHYASIKLGDAEAKVSFEITAATPTIVWSHTTASVDYTGKAAVITAPAVTLVNGETFSGTINYSYTGTSSGTGLPTNAGTYTITASIAAQGNYTAATSTNKLMLTIEKQKITISGMSWEVPTDAVYNNTAYTATLSGDLPAGVKVEVSGNTGISAGTYNATAKFSLAEGYSADNYEIVNGDDLTKAWSIAKATAPVITFPTVLNAIGYDEPVKNAKLSFYQNDYGTFDWTAPDAYPDMAGNRSYAVDFTPSDLNNYDWANYVGISWIEERSALCTTVSVVVNKIAPSFAAPTAKSGLTYNAAPQELVTAGTANGGTMHYSLDGTNYSADIPTGTNVGTYTVWYKVVGDSNHNDTEKASVTVTIAKADPAIGAVTAYMVNDTTEISAIVLNRENTDVAGTLTVDDGQTLKLGDNEISWTFTPADTGNYNTVTGTVTVTVRDTIAPTGTVTLSTGSWSAFLNTITFGKYFKETQTVSVTAADNLSGVAKVEYYETKDILDLDGVKALDEGKWTVMDGGEVSVTVEDAKQFIYYIRITDNSGNVSYLATNGAEFDTTAPVIDGVENGKTYYTAQVVTVTDKNLETVTLNGEPVTGTITLDGNKNASYTIAATDKAGNTATVTVTMAEIADIADPMDGLTDENVTSDDKEALEDIVDTADELLKDDNLTDEEKDALEDAKEKAEDLLDAIEDAASDLDTENTEKVEDITSENVKPEDKEALEKAKEDLEKALEENPGNYTNEEKQQIQEEIDRINDAIETIEKVENLTDEIEKLPASVDPDDEETAKDILDAKEDYDDLTDYEKSLIDDELKEKLDDLLADLLDYKITKGDGSKWTKDSGKTLSFTANGPLSKFVGIEIDGKEVNAKNYTVKADQTTVILKASYLETLKTGKHTITVLYTDGEAEGTFRVNRAADPSSPATGDDTNIMLWSGMLCVSTLGLVLLLADRKRRSSTK